MRMLIQAVLTYIAEKQTDYALMINGEWGSGKSFFITNDLRTAITKAYPKIKLVHVSLNGLESPEEIYQKILAEVIGDSRAFTRIGFGFLKTIMDLDIEIPKIGLKAKNIAKVLKDSSLVVARETSASPDMVLCFDDLERISSSLEIQSVLGYIHSNFIEFKNMKVLLVCDESKIDQMKYAVIKEKVIGRTHLFRLDIAEIFLSLVRAASTDEVFLRAMEREGPVPSKNSRSTPVDVSRRQSANFWKANHIIRRTTNMNFPSRGAVQPQSDVRAIFVVMFYIFQK